MHPETELLLQRHLRSRRWARRPYHAALWLAFVLMAPIVFGLLVAVAASFCRSLGIQ
jgi:hypothetical protein